MGLVMIVIIAGAVIAVGIGNALIAILEVVLPVVAEFIMIGLAALLLGIVSIFRWIASLFLEGTVNF
jgi:hypothetical protein